MVDYFIDKDKQNVYFDENMFGLEYDEVTLHNPIKDTREYYDSVIHITTTPRVESDNGKIGLKELINNKYLRQRRDDILRLIDGVIKLKRLPKKSTTLLALLSTILQHLELIDTTLQISDLCKIPQNIDILKTDFFCVVTTEDCNCEQSKCHRKNLMKKIAELNDFLWSKYITMRGRFDNLMKPKLKCSFWLCLSKLKHLICKYNKDDKILFSQYGKKPLSEIKSIFNNRVPLDIKEFLLFRSPVHDMLNLSQKSAKILMSRMELESAMKTHKDLDDQFLNFEQRDNESGESIRNIGGRNNNLIIQNVVRNNGINDENFKKSDPQLPFINKFHPFDIPYDKPVSSLSVEKIWRTLSILHASQFHLERTDWIQFLFHLLWFRSCQIIFDRANEPDSTYDSPQYIHISRQNITGKVNFELDHYFIIKLENILFHYMLRQIAFNTLLLRQNSLSKNVDIIEKKKNIVQFEKESSSVLFCTVPEYKRFIRFLKTVIENRMTQSLVLNTFASHYMSANLWLGSLEKHMEDKRQLITEPRRIANTHQREIFADLVVKGNLNLDPIEIIRTHSQSKIYNNITTMVFNTDCSYIKYNFLCYIILQFAIRGENIKDGKERLDVFKWLFFENFELSEVFFRVIKNKRKNTTKVNMDEIFEQAATKELFKKDSSSKKSKKNGRKSIADKKDDEKARSYSQCVGEQVVEKREVEDVTERLLSTGFDDVDNTDFIDSLEIPIVIWSGMKFHIFHSTQYTQCFNIHDAIKNWLYILKKYPSEKYHTPQCLLNIYQ